MFQAKSAHCFSPFFPNHDPSGYDALCEVGGVYMVHDQDTEKYVKLTECESKTYKTLSLNSDTATAFQAKIGWVECIGSNTLCFVVRRVLTRLGSWFLIFPEDAGLCAAEKAVLTKECGNKWTIDDATCVGSCPGYCQDEKEIISTECGGEGNVDWSTWNDETCTGQCLISKKLNYGPPQCE